MIDKSVTKEKVTDSYITNIGKSLLLLFIYRSNMFRLSYIFLKSKTKKNYFYSSAPSFIQRFLISDTGKIVWILQFSVILLLCQKRREI